MFNFLSLIITAKRKATFVTGLLAKEKKCRLDKALKDLIYG
jgi:hypothetical protein